MTISVQASVLSRCQIESNRIELLLPISEYALTTTTATTTTTTTAAAAATAILLQLLL